MISKMFAACCMMSILASATLAQGGAPPADAAARTTDLLAAFKAVHVPPEGGQLGTEQRAQNRQAFAHLDTFFDFDWLSEQAIAPHRKQLSREQLQRFLADFRELIRLVSFFRSAGFVQNAKVSVGKPYGRGAAQCVDMQASMPEQDMETRVTFVWQRRSTELRIVDVDFDGVSFIKDYQNQFGRMLKQHGPTGLLDKLAARRKRAADNA